MITCREVVGICRNRAIENEVDACKGVRVPDKD